ncbi:MAG: HlyD family efflux transporter periplasmic adaptor subunit [Bacteroidetes bacterium]|nr:HlyD family efflux transporter periplasmic adaptor subunit [Bacteroidota bacterium]
MKKRILLNNLFAGLLLVAMSSCKDKYVSTSPKMGPVTEAVFASGSIEPVDAYILTSLSDGFIVKAYVTENDLVHDGQVLFKLDNKQQHVQVNLAETNLQYAKINAASNAPNLQQIKAQIDAAKAKLYTDSVTLGRYQHLYETNSVSKQDYDNARLNYQSSLSSYRAQLASYRAAADKAQQDYQTSQLQVQNAEAGNQYYNLTAIGSGRVYQIFKKEGELVRKGDQVAQLGNPDSIVVKLDVDEGSIDKIKLGQQVLVELNTQKNKTYEARISKIYPHFNDNTQSYKVEAKFVEDVPGIIAGTQLQANIITNRKDNAMLIPHSYMLKDNKVLKKNGNKVDTTGIQTGIVSDEWVEVLSGLTVNDKIVKQR